MTRITPRKALVLTIFQGDDVATLTHLYRAKKKAELPAPNSRIDDDDASDEKTPETIAYDEAVDEAAQRAIEVWATQLGGRAFRDLLAAHPPREGNDGDQAVGYNETTFPGALLLASISTEPPVDSIPQFIDDIADGDFEQSFDLTYGMNRAVSADPRESRYSTTTPSTDATSDSPARLG